MNLVGHEDYECPLNFYQQYGECLPGFNERGYKIEEMWEAGAVEPKPELEKQWKKLKVRTIQNCMMF